MLKHGVISDKKMFSLYNESLFSHHIINNKLAKVYLFFGFVPCLSVEDVKGSLSLEEQAKVGRYRNPKDKHLYILSRGYLRYLLGAHLNIEPGQLEIEKGFNGKPYVKGTGHLRFNVSHSNEVIVWCFTNNGDLGIDIEYINRKVNIDLVSQYIMNTEEVKDFSKVSIHDKKEMFYKKWTEKEALAKLSGSGLEGKFDYVIGSNFPESNNYLSSQNSSIKNFSLLKNYRVALAFTGAEPIMTIMELKSIKKFEIQSILI